MDQPQGKKQEESSENSQEKTLEENKNQTDDVEQVKTEKQEDKTKEDNSEEEKSEEDKPETEEEQQKKQWAEFEQQQEDFLEQVQQEYNEERQQPSIEEIKEDLEEHVLVTILRAEIKKRKVDLKEIENVMEGISNEAEYGKMWYEYRNRKKKIAKEIQERRSKINQLQDSLSYDIKISYCNKDLKIYQKRIDEINQQKNIGPKEAEKIKNLEEKIANCLKKKQKLEALKPNEDLLLPDGLYTQEIYFALIVSMFQKTDRSDLRKIHSFVVKKWEIPSILEEEKILETNIEERTKKMSIADIENVNRWIEKIGGEQGFQEKHETKIRIVNMNKNIRSAYLKKYENWISEHIFPCLWEILSDIEISLAEETKRTIDRKLGSLCASTNRDMIECIKIRENNKNRKYSRFFFLGYLEESNIDKLTRIAKKKISSDSFVPFITILEICKALDVYGQKEAAGDLLKSLLKKIQFFQGNKAEVAHNISHFIGSFFDLCNNADELKNITKPFKIWLKEGLEGVNAALYAKVHAMTMWYALFYLEIRRDQRFLQGQLLEAFVEIFSETFYWIFSYLNYANISKKHQKEMSYCRTKHVIFFDLWIEILLGKRPKTKEDLLDHNGKLDIVSTFFNRMCLQEEVKLSFVSGKLSFSKNKQAIKNIMKLWLLKDITKKYYWVIMNGLKREKPESTSSDKKIEESNVSIQVQQKHLAISTGINSEEEFIYTLIAKDHGRNVRLGKWETFDNYLNISRKDIEKALVTKNVTNNEVLFQVRIEFGDDEIQSQWFSF